MERSDTPTTADAPAEVGKADTSPDDDRRAFKVALTYKPAAEGRWHALIAVGRAGCDPTLEPAEVADWPDALDAVPAAVAGAEARWAEAPRNKAAPLAAPAARPPSPKQQKAIDAALQRRKERQAAKRAAAEAKPDQAPQATPPSPPPAPPLAAGEKLSLF